MNTTRDFLLLAMDGITARMDLIAKQVEAIEQAANELNGRPQRRTTQAAVPDAAEPKTGRGKYTWTPAMREAAAARLRARWKAGAFNDKKGPKKAVKKAAKKQTAREFLEQQKPAVKLATKPAPAKKKVTHPWTPEQRAKLSASMKEAARRRGLKVRPPQGGHSERSKLIETRAVFPGRPAFQTYSPAPIFKIPFSLWNRI